MRNNAPTAAPAARSANPTDDPNKRKPVHEVRFGFIRAAVWENRNAEATWHSVTLSRSYKDGEEWRHTDSFNRDDLLLVAKAADLAHSWIHEQRQHRA